MYNNSHSNSLYTCSENISNYKYSCTSAFYSSKQLLQTEIIIYFTKQNFRGMMKEYEGRFHNKMKQTRRNHIMIHTADHFKPHPTIYMNQTINIKNIIDG